MRPGSEAPPAAAGTVAAAADPRPSPSAPVPEPAPPSATAASSVLRDLRENPFEFEFDAAVAILRRASAHSADPAAIRFEAATGLAFASSDVLSVRGGPDDAFRVVTGFLGLTGPAGALPRTYTEHVVAERRQRSSALADFLDMVAQRPATQFAAAAMKYRPHRIREEAALAAGRGDALRDTLLSLTGHAIPAVARGLGDAIEAVLHHAGAFAAHPRSADRLGAILSDWFGRTVTVQQFAGRWIRIGREEQSRMPWGDGGGRFHRLGVDAAVGTAAWDIQSTVILRVGPLSLREFESFLPGGPSLAALRALASAYLDDAVAFAVKPVLAAAEVPPLRMPRGSTAPSARLGQNTWLTTGAPRREDAEDTVVRSEP